MSRLTAATVRRTYHGCLLEPAGMNASGIRWTALCLGRTLRADTLAGLRSLIREEFRRFGIRCKAGQGYRVNDADDDGEG